jgi:hypothetical protein
MITYTLIFKKINIDVQQWYLPDFKTFYLITCYSYFIYHNIFMLIDLVIYWSKLKNKSFIYFVRNISLFCL